MIRGILCMFALFGIGACFLNAADAWEVRNLEKLVLCLLGAVGYVVFIFWTTFDRE